MREPVFTETLQISMVVCDLHATMRTYVEEYGIGPWEIYDYGIQKKIVSPLLVEFFYKRGYDRRATTAITIDEVLDAVLSQLECAVPADNRIIAK